MTGQPAASGAFPKNAFPPPRIPDPARTCQTTSAKPNEIPSAANALRPSSKNPVLLPKHKTRKRATQPPPKVFRVENTPVLYFHRFTKISACTHVSGRPPVFRSASCRSRAPGRWTSDNVVPATRRVLASRFIVGHAGMSVPHHAVRRSDPSLRRPIEDNHENLRDGCDS